MHNLYIDAIDIVACQLFDLFTETKTKKHYQNSDQFLVSLREIQSTFDYQLLSLQKTFNINRIQIIMGNKAQISKPQDSAAEIYHRKNQVEFKQINFIKEIQGSIEQEYELLSPCLEQNQFYQLRKAMHHKTKLIRAVYIVNKYKIRSHQREQFENQIHKLLKIDHPGVPKIYELFKNDHRFFVVFQYKSGQSLATILQNQSYFQESSAASIIWQLLSLLNHCHQRGITHTDLKLTSIAFNSKKQQIIKVEDFSISKIFRVEQIIQQSLGRAVLSAPQMISGQSSSKSDIWSCGVILYILFCGQPPILANTKSKLISKFKGFFLKFRQRRFRQVSQEGKEMIRKMMRINPNERPSADELMQNSWFTNFMKIPRLPLNSVKNCMKSLYLYYPTSKLQEATWTFFVNSLISFDQKQLIMSVFMKINSGSTGELDENDLAEGFLQIAQNQQQALNFAKKVMVRLNKKKIYFSQFLTYCANRFFLIREANLLQIFRIFDEDNSGQIEISQLKDTLGNSKQIGEQVWMQLIRQANANSDGKISYLQFCDLIRQLNIIQKGYQFHV